MNREELSPPAGEKMRTHLVLDSTLQFFFSTTWREYLEMCEWCFFCANPFSASQPEQSLKSDNKPCSVTSRHVKVLLASVQFTRRLLISSIPLATDGLPKLRCEGHQQKIPFCAFCAISARHTNVVLIYVPHLPLSSSFTGVYQTESVLGLCREEHLC